MALLRWLHTGTPGNANAAGGNGTTAVSDPSGTDPNRAWASLAEAANALGASLSEAVHLGCLGSIPDTSNVNQTVWDMTTTATNYLWIFGSGIYGGGVYWRPNAYTIQCTNRHGLYNNLPAHVRYSHLQVEVTVNDGNSYVGLKTSNANQTETDIDCRVWNCMVKGIVSGVGSSLIGFESRPPAGGADGISRDWNNVAWNCTQGIVSDWNKVTRYNCLAYGGDYGFVDGATLWTPINCVAANNANSGFVGPFHANANYNFTWDTSAPGSNPRNSRTFTFIDAANGDFRWAKTDSGARDLALADPGSGLFNYDGLDVVRAGSWDGGPHEYVPANALTFNRLRPRIFAMGLPR